MNSIARYILMALFAGFFWLVVLSTAWATPVPIDWKVSGTTAAMLIENPDKQCKTGSLLNIPLHIQVLSSKTDTETFDEFVNRAIATIFTRSSTPEEQALCDALFAANAAVWIVDQYRTYPTRPVYEINANFPSVKVKIGTVPHSTVCGKKVADYSATITAYEWREVTVNGLTGASVCRKQ